ncbi:redoxin domain-containing protein [Paenibacillus sp. FSL F4-0122]|uniref:TlpA family protein disulfide reductase n=1 Tax=Paenibacillus sp. FSL F4-0122 TaxID=2921371 RepID=UPI000F95EC69
MRLRRIVALLLVAVIAAAIVWVFINHSSQARVEGIEEGAYAPDFKVMTLSGEEVSLTEHRGKVVLLNFWASWCKPCMQEMPLLNEIHQSSNSQIETLFINVGESKGTVSEYMKELQFSFPVAIDVTGKISTAFGVTALPSTFIINEEGEIAKIRLGEIDDFTLLQQWLADAKVTQ